jgi:hypothetical protein
MEEHGTFLCLDLLWHHDRCTQTLLDTVGKPCCLSHQLGRLLILINCSLFPYVWFICEVLPVHTSFCIIMTSSGWPTHAPPVGSRRDLNLLEPLDAVGGQFHCLFWCKWTDVGRKILCCHRVLSLCRSKIVNTDLGRCRFTQYPGRRCTSIPYVVELKPYWAQSCCPIQLVDSDVICCVAVK